MRPITTLLSLAVVGALLGGCASSTSTTVPSAEPSTLPAPTPTPTLTLTPATPTPAPTTAPTPAPTPTPSTATSCVDATFATLTEAQRIGQLFTVGLSHNELKADLRAAIAKHHIGSVWFTTKTTVGTSALRRVSDAVQDQATDTATGGVGFFVAANQEGGLIQALAGPGFDRIPSAVDQGKLDPSVLVTKANRWARQLRIAGVNMNFAPVADVVPAGTEAENAPIGQLKREFGSNPTSVARHVRAFVEGMASARIATTAKHFPGLGRVEGNTDNTRDVVDSVTTRSDPYLAPFQAAIDAGAPFVMISLATYERIDPGHLAAFSPAIMSDLLRDRMGFRGVVISDSLTATAVVSMPPGTRAIDFLAAGGDLVTVNNVDAAVQMTEAVAARAKADASFRARVDDAAMNVLRAKDAAGLLPCD
jgi:beta-N-acetylhexosaminidase